MLFLRISIVTETEMELSREFVKTQWNMGENDKRFLFSHFFLLPQNDETFLI